MTTADEQEILSEKEESKLDLPKRFDRSWVYFVEGLIFISINFPFFETLFLFLTLNNKTNNKKKHQ